jgi:hypothetical protein
MESELQIGVAYDGETLGIILIVHDDDTDFSCAMTPSQAGYLGTRLIALGKAMGGLEDEVAGMPLERAEAYIDTWVKRLLAEYN